MSHVIHASMGETPPVAARGEGVYLIDEQGHRVLDASGGPSVACLGHGNAEVIAAIKGQLDELAYAFGGFFTTRAAEELGDYLAEHAPGPLNHVFYCSGGSEGVESALKFARQYFLEVGQPQRHKFIARRQDYHGATLGALAVGGQTLRREPYAPMLMDVAHIAPCFPYREQQPGESDDAYAQRAADELEAAIQAAGPDTVAAFIAEPVVGASLGAVAAPAGYFRRIREICDRHGILLILDEVLCGMGRTGSLFAHEQEDIPADLCVIAKGLGAGYQPIGAVMVAQHIVDAVARGSGAFKNLFTYQGHPLACAAAMAVQRVIQRDGLLANVRRMGEHLHHALRDAFTEHPHVGDVRGRGLMQAVELVADRDSKTPFPAERQLAARVRRLMLAHGLSCYPMAGTVDGLLGDHVKLAPPYIINEDHVAEMVDKLRATVDAALAESA